MALAFIGDTTALNSAHERQRGTSGGRPVAAAARRVPGGRLRRPAAHRSYDHPRPDALRPLRLRRHAGALRGRLRARPDPLRHIVTVGLVYRPMPAIALKGDFTSPDEFGAGPGFDELASAIAWMF